MQPIKIFTFKGIPVHLNPFFFILIIVLSMSMGSLLDCVCFGICAAFGVLFHEFGHAFVARHYGLNPSIILQGLGGTTMHERAPERQECLITLAGPLAGLAIACLCYAFIFAVQFVPFVAQIFAASPVLSKLISFTALVNLVWGIFNLIPIIPMDGSKVLNYVLRRVVSQQTAAKISASLSILLLTGAFAWALLTKNMFMIILFMFMIMINYAAVKAAFQNSAPSKALDRGHLLAEQAYERGLVAAREHDWKTLRVAGNQMKKHAHDPEQRCRAYELLTIAATNECDYRQALEFAPLARQTDAVKRAVERCKSHLELDD